MTVARIYTLEASAGREQNLRDALTGLAETILGLPGCGGVELLQDAAKPHRFVFIEKWLSFESHKAAAAMLPKDAFASVMQLLAGKPESGNLNYLISG